MGAKHTEKPVARLDLGRFVIKSSALTYEPVMTWSLSVAKTHRDPRGALTALDESELPFPPKRTYWIYDVPAGTVRGAHAHRLQRQMLICLTGRLEVPLDDGQRQETIVLSSPDQVLLINEMVWSHQKALVADTCWIFIASGAHDPTEYINTHALWAAEVARGRP